VLVIFPIPVISWTPKEEVTGQQAGGIKIRGEELGEGREGLGIVTRRSRETKKRRIMSPRMRETRTWCRNKVRSRKSKGRVHEL
jgi:hypothetical protein